MRETSCCFFLTIIKLILLNHLTLRTYLSDKSVYTGFELKILIDNPYFEQMVSEIYLAELQLKTYIPVQ